MKKLLQSLKQIERKSYSAYKSLKGSFSFPGYELNIEHVQGDPFASPSKLSVRVSSNYAKFPQEYFVTKEKRIATQDFLLRSFYKEISKYSNRAKGSGKSGVMMVTRCGQEVLERTGCQIDEKSGDITIRFEVGFPANGRTINALEFQKIVCDYLPICIEKGLRFQSADKIALKKAVELAEDQKFIREELKKEGYLAFVANESILPRIDGVRQTMLKEGIPFVSPKSMELTLDLPNKGRITGMGIRKGITLIVGGGYHGKSTLLKGIERGVYNHILGDGREYVITDEDAMKIRAEDGRSIKNVDISLFINNLPNGKDTISFTTEDASGSTSQAANVIEAIEARVSTLLIDEDTSATNFMVRDELMQRVVHRDKEPIIPFIERAKLLKKDYDVSTIMVAGSSGAYFHIADTILQMDEYEPIDITEVAKKEAEKFPYHIREEGDIKVNLSCRKPKRVVRGDRVKTKTFNTDGFMIDREEVDLRLLEQIVDREQVECMALLLTHMEQKVFDGEEMLAAIIDKVYDSIEKRGIKSVIAEGRVPGNLVVPRKMEVFAMLNRYRGLKL